MTESDPKNGQKPSRRKAVASAIAILREHGLCEAGLLIIPTGKKARIIRWGDRSFVRGLMLDAAKDFPAYYEEEPGAGDEEEDED